MRPPPKKPSAKSTKPARKGEASPAKATASAAESDPALRPRRPGNARKPKLEVPPILLEGDEPSPAPVSGPGERFALGTPPAIGSPPPAVGDLPEAYGTQRLLLTARDPKWLYAHWDMTTDQLRRYNARSVDRHLVLRIYRNEAQGEPHREIHVHPESRNWFANVAEGASRYVAELGYYRPNDQWVSIAVSGPTITPPDNLSEDTSVWFTTLPIDLRSEQLLKLIKTALRDNVPLMEAIQQLRIGGYSGLPDPRSAAGASWTASQDAALAQVVSMDSVRRVWVGSLEITELIRRQFMQELSSMAASQFSIPSSWSGAVSSFSSPLGGMGERGKGFWFNVNAELIIYGATEPDATVTIGGRTIRLRPDGSFSYRFILPDGRYQLPAIATSADGTDSRSAALEFSRSTQYRGDVQAHPQDPAMKPPRVEHVS